LLYNEYSLLGSANENKRTHSLDVYRSLLMDQLHSVSGVSYVEITFFGKDVLDSTTDEDNLIECRFDEIILLSEKQYVAGVLIHGPLFTYEVVSA